MELLSSLDRACCTAATTAQNPSPREPFALNQAWRSPHGGPATIKEPDEDGRQPETGHWEGQSAADGPLTSASFTRDSFSTLNRAKPAGVSNKSSIFASLTLVRVWQWSRAMALTCPREVSHVSVTPWCRCMPCATPCTPRAHAGTWNRAAERNWEHLACSLGWGAPGIQCGRSFPPSTEDCQDQLSACSMRISPTRIVTNMVGRGQHRAGSLH